MSRMGEDTNRTLWLLAALGMFAMASVSCSSAAAGTGNSGGDTASANSENTATLSNGINVTTTANSDTTATPHEQAVKFAECMRANGVSEFPDPNGSGGFTIEDIANNSSLDTSSTAFEQAMGACRDLEPPGFTGGQRSLEQQVAAIKFAQCVRDNGVPDFPDPGLNDPMIDTNRIPSANRPGGMTILDAAMQKCRGFAAEAGVKGP